MKVIADPETAGIETSCLAISWNLPDVCQVQGCKEKTFAILCFTAEETNGDTGALNIVICKNHYEEGKEKGSIKWKFDLKRRRKEMEIRDIPMSKVVKVRYETEEERRDILKALEVLDTPVKVLKYTG